MKKILNLFTLLLLLSVGHAYAAKTTLSESINDSLDGNAGDSTGQDQRLTVFANFVAQNLMNTDLYGQYPIKWTTGNTYTASVNIVVHGGELYICTAGNNAPTDTEPGVGAYWEDYWRIVPKIADIPTDNAELSNGAGYLTSESDPSVDSSAEIQAIIGSNIYQSYNANTDIDSTNDVVLSGDQTIAGVKTFSSIPILPSSDPTTDYQVASKKYVDDNAGGSPDLTGYSLIDGTRDYTGIVGYNSHPTFAADTDIVDKKYVDDAIVGGGSYTDEQAQDAWGSLLSGGTQTGIAVTYDDASGTASYVVTESDPTVDSSAEIQAIIGAGVYAAVLGADDNYVTDAEKVVIGNTSGTNTGDIPSGSFTPADCDLNDLYLVLGSLYICTDGDNNTWEEFSNITIASQTPVVTDNFDGYLSSADTTVQLALETIDDITVSYPDISGTPIGDAEVYGSGWDGDTSAPQKNDIYDKIETIAGGSMTYPGAGIPLSTGSAWGTSYTITTFKNALDDESWTFANVISAPGFTSTAADGAHYMESINTVAITAAATAGRIAYYNGEHRLANGTNWTADYMLRYGHIGSVVQGYDADLNTYAGITPSANVQSLLAGADFAAIRVLLDLESGTDFNAYDANLPTWPSTVDATEVGYLNGVTSSIQTQISARTVKIASGTATLGTSAIADGACATVVTVSASGVLTTDVINPGFQGTPVGTTGYDPTAASLSIVPYPTANNVNFLVCNNTGASITPGAMTINWRVDR